MPSLAEILVAGQREGWKLTTTIDNGTTRPYYDIVGLTMSDRDACRFVMRQAKTNSSLHLEAIRLVMHSRAKSPRKTKRK